MPSGRWQRVTTVLRSEPSVFMAWIHPAFSSRTKRRGTTPFATALREDFTTASDISHLHGCPTRTPSGSTVTVPQTPLVILNAIVATGMAVLPRLVRRLLVSQLSRARAPIIEPAR